MSTIPKTLSGTVPLFFTSNIRGPDDLIRGFKSAVNAVTFYDVTEYGNDPDRVPDGWVRIGHAEVTLHLISADKLVDNKVESLRAELTSTRAEAEAKCTQIQRQINTLLAITNEVHS